MACTFSNIEEGLKHAIIRLINKIIGLHAIPIQVRNYPIAEHPNRAFLAVPL
jgi:hypothetical protein